MYKMNKIYYQILPERKEDPPLPEDNFAKCVGGI